MGLTPFCFSFSHAQSYTRSTTAACWALLSSSFFSFVQPRFALRLVTQVTQQNISAAPPKVCDINLSVSVHSHRNHWTVARQEDGTNSSSRTKSAPQNTQWIKSELISQTSTAAWDHSLSKYTFCYVLIKEVYN